MSKYHKEWEPGRSKRLMSGLNLPPWGSRAGDRREAGGAGLKGVGDEGNPTHEKRSGWVGIPGALLVKDLS